MSEQQTKRPQRRTVRQNVHERYVPCARCNGKGALEPLPSDIVSGSGVCSSCSGRGLKLDQVDITYVREVPVE